MALLWPWWACMLSYDVCLHNYSVFQEVISFPWFRRLVRLSDSTEHFLLGSSGRWQHIHIIDLGNNLLLSLHLLQYFNFYFTNFIYNQFCSMLFDNSRIMYIMYVAKSIKYLVSEEHKEGSLLIIVVLCLTPFPFTIAKP